MHTAASITDPTPLTHLAHLVPPPLPIPRPQLKLRYDVDSLENRDPWFVEHMVRFVEKVMYPYHRAVISGLEHVPSGGALYVGNHSGASMTIDSFIFGAAVYRAGGLAACPHILTHDLPLSLPGLHQVFSALGGVRATPHNAQRLFDAGHKVLVYPGGHEEAMRPYGQRDRIHFGGHRGYIRTALRNRVPIVPIVGQGSHATCIVFDDAKWFARLTHIDRLARFKSWPLVFSIPWGITFGPPLPYLPLPARIRMELLAPIHFDRGGDEAAGDEAYVTECAELVERRMQQSLDRLALASQPS